jgi:sortase A
MAIHVYKKEYYSAKKQVAHFFSYISLTVGTLLLFWSFYPFLSFQIYSKLFIQRDITSPIPAPRTITAMAKGTMGTYNIYSSNLRDFVQADLWFPTKPQITPSQKLQVKDYTLSIPKLNIVNAKVAVGGEDLSKSLVHYIPTSLPGEAGNVAIFGHSALPFNYNPKDYRTIFTYLPSMEKGDKMYIKIGDQNLTYEVFDMFIVEPEEVSVLDQNYDDSYLTVVTCVPPGSIAERMIVRARIVKE